MHAALVVVLIFLGTSAYSRYEVAREMASRKQSIQRELSELEARRSALIQEVSYITSERGIEAEMRRQFDVVREGEQVVIIIDEPATPAP